MKRQLQGMALLSTTIIATIVGNIGISLAKPLPNIQINEVPKINRNDLIKIRLNPTTTYGQVEVKFGKYASQGSLQCKDLSVVLYSDEKQPAPPAKPGEFQLEGPPIFSYSKKLTGNLNTGKCNYSISTDSKYSGKKAWLDFRGGGDYTDGAKSIIVPSKATKFNTKVVFGNIG